MLDRKKLDRLAADHRQAAGQQTSAAHEHGRALAAMDRCSMLLAIGADDEYEQPEYQAAEAVRRAFGRGRLACKATQAVCGFRADEAAARTASRHLLLLQAEKGWPDSQQAGLDAQRDRLYAAMVLHQHLAVWHHRLSEAIEAAGEAVDGLRDYVQSTDKAKQIAETEQAAQAEQEETP